jgi:hypothetical protein
MLISILFVNSQNYACVCVNRVVLLLHQILLYFTTWKINGVAEITAFDNGFK